MKTLIETYLTNCGYTNITWHQGRKGYYILAERYNSTNCIDIDNLIQHEILWHEIGRIEE